MTGKTEAPSQDNYQEKSFIALILLQKVRKMLKVKVEYCEKVF
jgi:hypothetical protein